MKKMLVSVLFCLSPGVFGCDGTVVSQGFRFDGGLAAKTVEIAAVPAGCRMVVEGVEGVLSAVTPGVMAGEAVLYLRVGEKGGPLASMAVVAGPGGVNVPFSMGSGRAATMFVSVGGESGVKVWVSGVVRYRMEAN